MRIPLFRRQGKPDVRFPATAGTIVLFVAALALAGAAAVYAQEEGGPSPEEIAAFEREFAPPEPAGGPDESQIERPEFEEPGEVPEEVRALVPASDIVAVYCATTRWKSGNFFAAMDAIQEHLVPAMQKLSGIGIEISIPDTAELKSQGEARIAAICAAKSVDDADRLIREFMSWGKSAGDEKFAALRTDMRTKIQAMADKMRVEIKAALDPYVEEQKGKITAEIDAAARSLAETKSARFAGYTQAPSEAEIDALKAEITNELQGMIDQKKTEVAATVQAKVKEIVGDKQKNMEDAMAGFKGMEKRMNDAIKAGAAKYDSYREEAIGLRKKMVLDILDASLESGLKELDAHATEIDEARKEDSSVPSVGDVKSKLAEERRTLETKLDTALRAGDEQAFQSALADFKVRWETYRVDMEKAASQSVSKVCTVALAQFDEADRQIVPGLQRINDLRDRCATEDSEECVRVNEFSDRLGTLVEKIDDIRVEMGAAEKMCATPETADRKNLIALMRKIQSDGAALKEYGEALEADKQEARAAGVKELCDRALTQLKAAETEIGGNDLAQLGTKISSCKAQKTDECVVVNQLSARHGALTGLMSAFSTDVEKVRAACRNPDPAEIEKLSVILEGIRATGEDIRSRAKELKAEAAEKGSARGFCKQVGGSLDLAKGAAAAGLSQFKAQRARCAGKTDPGCNAVNGLKVKFDAFEKRVADLNKAIGEILASCKNASTESPPSQDLIAKADRIRSEGKDIPAAAEALKLEAENAAKTSQSAGVIWVEAENEARTNLLPRTEQWHSIKGKSTDSWRPPVYGSGYWYLSRGNEWLEYDIAAPVDGTYDMWIRDLASNVPGQEGKGVVTVQIDGKSLGSFAENEKGRSVAYPKGAFNWHKVASVTLSKGRHKLRIVKQSTSSRAAILDAYYFSTGPETPSEK